MVKTTVLHQTWSVVGLNPHQCLWIHDLQVCGLVAMLVAKRLGSVAPEMNRRNPFHAGGKAHK